ncbi:MAG: GNAT family N-acetyltransferase [Fimbriimonas sp.]
MISVRQATHSDYGSYCELWNGIWQNLTKDIAELTRDDDLPVHLRSTRWLAILDGQAIGFAEAYRPAGSYQATKWLIEVGVNPLARRKGVGRALVTTALDYVEIQGMQIVDARVNGEDEYSIGFAQRRGFEEISRDFESVLDLESCDPQGLRKLASTEFEIESIAASDSPEFRIALHQAFEEVRQDVPRRDPAVPLTFEFFMEATLEDPSFLMEGSRVLLDGDRIAGFAGLFKSATEGRIDTWLTSLRREYRGRGLAQALKASTILWAKANGYASIRTDNNSDNAPMLAINDKLGYKRSAAILTMRKQAVQ